MNRRGFLKGLLATTVAVSAPVIKIVNVPVRYIKRWIFGDMKNWGAWDRRYEFYSEAKEASDKISKEVLERMLKK
jgi:hypothetical protein